MRPTRPLYLTLEGKKIRNEKNIDDLNLTLTSKTPSTFLLTLTPPWKLPDLLSLCTPCLIPLLLKLSSVSPPVTILTQ